MKITGIKEETVVVDVRPEDMVIGLSRMIHVGSLFNSERDCYARLEVHDLKHYLVKYENISHHGSPLYEETYRSEISAEEYRAAEGLEVLMNIIKRRKKVISD